jgi:hypothetical protein
MARPRFTGEEFSHADLAIASGMTKRAVQHLGDSVPRLLPEGKGTNVLKRVAVIGALVNGGMPLMVAGRFAALLTECFNQNDGEVPCMIGGMARSLPPKDRQRDGDYWYHQRLLAYPDIYHAGRPTPQDAIVEIVDKTHIYLHQRFAGGGGTLDTLTGKPLPEDRDYVARVEGWARGVEPQLIPAHELVSYDPADPDFRWKADAFVAMRAAVWEKRVAVLSINVSLAIRNAFDRLAHDRALGRRS